MAINSEASAIAERCKAQYGDDVIVDFAMRHGKPAIGDTMSPCWKKAYATVVLPLYPQYSASTTGSTFAAIAKDFTVVGYLNFAS